MYSETGMIGDCQHIYTSYLNGTLPVSDSVKLLRKIDRMLSSLSHLISYKSEEGDNTVFLEKIQTDLLFIRDDIRTPALSGV